MRCSRRNQSGIALLMAILVVVAATAISVSMVHDESFVIRKTSRQQLLDRAGLYALGLEDFARIVLKVDREDNKIDDLNEDWALGVPGTPIEAGYLGGYMEDEQSRFNINGLLNSQEAVTRFTRLCNNLDVDPSFIPALLDWIDDDLEARFPGGAEDESYDTYRVANRLMADVSELLLVKNVTHEMYGKLKEHITALPTMDLKLNVNTVTSMEIFKSLEDDLSDADFEKFDEERADENGAFTSIDDLETRMQIPFTADGLSVDTEYFTAFGQVVQADLEYNFKTLIHRDNKGATRVISRSLGLF